jgi:hypothetical protein
MLAKFLCLPTSRHTIVKRSHKDYVSTGLHSRRYSARLTVNAVVSVPPKGRRSGSCAKAQHNRGKPPFEAARCRRPFAASTQSQRNFNGAGRSASSGWRTNRARLLSPEWDDIDTRGDEDGRANRNRHRGKRRRGRCLDWKQRFTVGWPIHSPDCGYGMASPSLEFLGIVQSERALPKAHE